MNIQQLKPASALAMRYGVKCLAYGPPGSGKTPLINSAPRPVLCVCEPGMLSMRNSKVPAWQAFTTSEIDEFFKWALESKEAAQFDTICIDSVSQMAETYLKESLDINKHGLKAYGDMATKVMKHVDSLYFMQNKHVYLVAKQALIDVAGIKERRPYFPGQELNVRVPHLYDVVVYISPVNMPPHGTFTAIRTKSNYEAFARDRSGLLAELEPPDLTALFAKAMA